MWCALGNLQLCIKNRIIKRRRYLTQSASDTFHNLSVLISTSHHIAIFFCIRKGCLLHRKFFSRHYNSSIDQFRCTPDVLHAVSPSGVCCIRAKLILQRLQICLFYLWFFCIQFQLNFCILIIPFFIHEILNLLYGFVHINSIAFRFICQIKSTSIIGCRCIDRFLLQRNCPLHDQLSELCFINFKAFVYNIFLLIQIMHLLITAPQASGFSVSYCLFGKLVDIFYFRSHFLD